jgi:Fe2+ transport system protein FeoA
VEADMKNMEQTLKVKYLSNLSEGETGEIIQLRGKPEMHRYLSGKGLTMGRSISVNSTLDTPENCFLTIRAGDRVEVIDKAAANNIKVMVG